MDHQIRKIPMALLRDIEEPREFPDQETPNGASPALEKLELSRPKLASTSIESVINKTIDPFLYISQNDGL